MDFNKVLKSFPPALRGIELATRERNMRVHLLAVVFVTLSGIIFQLSLTEWIGVFLCFSLVMSLEAVNTAIEGLCNKLRDDLGLSYQSTKNIRDISAGAVLIAAFLSVIVAILVFLPKIIYLVE